MNLPLPPIDPSWLATGGAVPLAIAAAGGAAARLVGRPWPKALLWAAGLVGGYAAGFAVLQGRPWDPPIDSLDGWALVGVPAAVGVAMLGAASRLPVWAAWIARAIVAAGLVPLMLQAYLTYHWSAGEAAVYVTLIPLAVLGIWAALHGLHAAGHGRLVVAALAGAALAVSAATGASGSLVLGQHAGSVAAVLLGAAIAAVPGREDVAGLSVVIDVGLLLLVAALMQGRFFGETMTDLHAALLLAAPAAVGIVRLPPVQRARPWQQCAAALGAAATVAAIGVALAAVAGLPEEAPGGDTDAANPYEQL